MLYIVYGSQSALVRSRIKKICQEEVGELDEMNYVRFSYPENSIFEVLDEASYVPLGYDKKVIVYSDFSLLGKVDKKTKESDQYKALLSYLKSPNEQTTLVFSLYEDKIDDKNEIVSLIKDNGTVISRPLPNEIEWKELVARFIKEKAGGASIDRDALIELANRTYCDVDLMRNSAKKLALYTNHITHQDVVLMVERPLEENVFQIFNALLDGKNGVALRIYRDLRVKGVEPVSLVTTLSNQLRTFSMVHYLTKNNYSIKGISEELGINEIRAKILSRQVYNMKENAIKRAFDELYNLDYQIKSGQVDRFYAFELFLANFKVR
ncbi:MAG: DNA polymerase III subunit delta [Erysipelotrichaceae bacterium]|nr:DNA polymerase III subunit delta [Erysipelotrichaceae bacterium]